MRVGSLSCDKLYNMFNLKNIMLMKKIALLLVGLLIYVFATSYFSIVCE